ncbi:transposase (plasmid) [Aureibacter tunicatorum]|nr:transposase [Aureibacter tunicatorum]BDD06017.1 transposase [Aureibacter tunicatorum]BDD06659.1 transposase [Aureibacter tunicatorum]
MPIKLRLITLYSYISNQYNTHLRYFCQRFSNNSNEGKFSDVEILTCYFFSVIEEEVFKIKKIHRFIQNYWKDWFPHLPSYQAFSKRLNRLESILPMLVNSLVETLLSGHDLEQTDRLIDSMPIILSKGRGNGKVASNIADKTYSSSKKIHYYGVKLHMVSLRVIDKMPTPELIGITKASNHDLPPVKGVLAGLKNCKVFADKAYADHELEDLLYKNNNVSLLTPEKLVKGESPYYREFAHAFRKQWGKAISSVRQPVEVFFNWLIEKTGIQDASKVRSEKGLMVHIYGKLASALLILANF